MDNMRIYKKYAEVPKEAQKTIGGGRLQGFTDIEPLWRIRSLTEEFGPVGFGWYYTIDDKRIEEGANGEMAAFVDISLYVRVDETWSMPIKGTGGSMFVASEKKGLYTSDEAYKMALTDAISVSCKALGMGATIYWKSGGSTKYSVAAAPDPEPVNGLNCEQCGVAITGAVKEYSAKYYGKQLCRKCQSTATKI